MKDFEAIKVLWKVQEEMPVSYDHIMKNIGTERKNYARRLAIQTVAVSFAIMSVLAIWLFKPFFTWTTHLSMFILCFCLGYYLVIQFRDYRQIQKADRLLLKPQDFITYLKNYKLNSYILDKRNYKIYTLGIGTAFLLILFELYFILPILLLLLFAVAAIGWFFYSYFVLMKAYIQKESDHIEEMIVQLEKLKKQLEE